MEESLNLAGEEKESERTRGRMRLRRSDMSNIERARTRTLRMTVTIVLAFIWCWTPYVVMTLWYMFDRASAERVDTWIQDGLFIMAVSNSCMNPLVYGSYAMNLRRECAACFCCDFTSQQELLQRKSTDGVRAKDKVISVPKCLCTFFKGSAATRSTGVSGLANMAATRNQLGVVRRHLRPVSTEQLMTKAHCNNDEYHSDPGGVYLVAS